ncbi:carbohydrate-binding domain-containing protein [Paenibacillus oralis]|uniref:Carbohydrate-binding domain-containing protein n=1 Tax=Paenibacillus oralis TaxID=2490856 RepID=A0A3P3TZG9_9BACL|nr:carbohydrate-binding domain-containing protein [Paenibacillus oralis]RRJ62668.1 carbohydrate-binding domain-containing protein [Paenibacillus oralis]
MKNFTAMNKLGIVLLCSAMLSACGSVSANGGAAAGTQQTSAAADATAASVEGIRAADLVTFDDSDNTVDWSADSATTITLNGANATVDGAGAEAEDGTVTITAAGTYVLSGELSEGQIVVDAQDEGDVHLVLNGVDIHDSDSAPIYVKAAGKAIVTLAAGTENTVSDGETYVFPDASDDEPNAAVFSKADLTINGEGKLAVNANYMHGINSKDDLKIMSGTLVVNAADDGIRGKDMVAVQDGNITVTAGGDGIKSNNDTDEAKGFVAIAGGTFDIQAGNDGIQAETSLVVDGGTFDLVTGGGNENGEDHTEDNGPGGPGGGGAPGGGGWPGTADVPQDAGKTEGAAGSSGNVQTEDTAGANGADDTAVTEQSSGTTDTDSGTVTTEETESQSAKGLKASGNVIIHDGSFTVDSADDAIHSNGNVGIKGGNFSIQTGDDGVHADITVEITGGTLDIAKSYEGIEGAAITISGGETHIVASDDGVNVTGGNDESVPGGPQGQDQTSDTGTLMFAITGGSLTVDAAGDGLDSNGSIEMSGGTVIVNGPTSDGNGTLDYDGSFTISGGILVGAGSAGMAQAPSDASSQYSVAMNFTATQAAGTLVHLEDSAGNSILTFAPAKDYRNVVISSPDLKAGSYTLYSGGSSTGTPADGLYTDGEYSGGTKVVSFEITDSVTTWLNESGVTDGNSMGRGPGGGGGRGGRGGIEPQGGLPADQQTAEESNTTEAQ